MSGPKEIVVDKLRSGIPVGLSLLSSGRSNHFSSKGFFSFDRVNKLPSKGASRAAIALMVG